MKLMMVLGGLIGFLMGVGLGMAQGSAWGGILWRASVAALVLGLLMRWWGRIWIRSLVDAQRERATVSLKASVASSSGPVKV